MTYQIRQGFKAMVLSPEDRLDTMQAALDVIGTAWYEGCGGVIVPKACLPEAFFQLRTGYAGEVLQKFTNYQLKVAIVGDFSGYQSQSLKDFIYESNKGTQVFFKQDEEAAMASF